MERWLNKTPQCITIPNDIARKILRTALSEKTVWISRPTHIVVSGVCEDRPSNWWYRSGNSVAVNAHMGRHLSPSLGGHRGGSLRDRRSNFAPDLPLTCAKQGPLRARTNSTNSPPLISAPKFTALCGGRLILSAQ